MNLHSRRRPRFADLALPIVASLTLHLLLLLIFSRAQQFPRDDSYIGTIRSLQIVEVKYASSRKKENATEQPKSSRIDTDSGVSVAARVDAFDPMAALEHHLKTRIKEPNSAAVGATSIHVPKAGALGPPIFGGEGGAHKAAGRKFGLKEHLTNSPLLDEIYRQIDSHLDYPLALLREDKQGATTLHFEVDSDGSLLEIEDDRRDQSPLRGYGLKVIIDALKNFRFAGGQKASTPIKISAQFRFTILSDREAIINDLERIHGNQLNFSRVRFKKVELSWGDSNEGSGEVSDELRIFSDLNRKRREFEFACEHRRLAGACAELAQIERDLGNHGAADQYQQKACELGLVKSCEP